MIWRRNRSGRNKGRGAVVASKREIFDEASVCSRHGYGNLITAISNRFPSSEFGEFWRIRGWFVCRQQRQRRRFAERRLCRCRIARYQRRASRTGGCRGT
jgi:hypothetical protein